MHVHKRFHRVWVEAMDVLALEEERWKAGRTDEEAMMASRAGRGGLVSSGKRVCARGGGSVAHVGSWGASPGPAGRPTAEHAARQGRACGVWPGSAVRRLWPGHLARPEARDHLAGDGRAPAREPGPTGVSVRPKYAGRVGTPRRTDDATSQPEHADAQERFRVALFDWFKQ
jgi:hypothetical protein